MTNNTTTVKKRSKRNKKNKNHKFYADYVGALKCGTAHDRKVLANNTITGRRQSTTTLDTGGVMALTSETQPVSIVSTRTVVNSGDDDIPCIELHFNHSNSKPSDVARLPTLVASAIGGPDDWSQDKGKGKGTGKDAIDNSDNAKDTLRRAAAPILTMAQCFGIMPVSGIREDNVRHMKFSVCSLPMVFTLLFLFSGSLILSCQVKYVFATKVTAKSFVGVVFFSNVILASILFLVLAPKWPALMRSWANTEKIFLSAPYTTPKHRLARRLQVAAVMIILLSIIEHGLAVSSWSVSYFQAASICAMKKNMTDKATFNSFAKKNFNYVFHYLPYNMAMGIFIFATNAACTFVWNYMDLFIMLLSRCIAYRFEQINIRLRTLAEQEVEESIFSEIRIHYVLVCELLDNVDEHLSNIVLLSCANNLYFICVQLLNIFNKLRWPINYIYFWYSLLYLIGRTAFVFLSAATINDESKAALTVLRRVPHKSWCVEVERLIFQMSTQTMALSGKKFYFLTRGLLFGMAGTIVTYELVLLQFDEPSRALGLPDLCA